jgi:hypothetical protein
LLTSVDVDLLFGGIVGIFGQLHESTLQVRRELQVLKSFLSLQHFILFNLFAIATLLNHRILELIKSLHDLLLFLEILLLRVIESFIDLFEGWRDGVGEGWLLRAGLWMRWRLGWWLFDRTGPIC